MPRMRRCAAMLVAIGLVVPGNATVVAQAPSIGVGVDVPYTDPAGAEAGLVTIRKIEDPFTGYREDSPPADGQKYVLLTVAFEAADDKPFEAHPSDIILQDTDGFLWSYTDVTRPADATPKELQSQDLAAGDRVSGVIGFVVPKSSIIDQVFYQPPSGGRLITLVDQVPQVGPPVGTDVPYSDPTGAEAGLVTVRSMEDPFTAYREDSPPADGQRYVLLTVAFEAADDKPFEAHPSDIILQDTDGFLWSYTDVTRPSDATPKELQSQDLAAGDRVSGAIGFVVPESSIIDQVFYQPTSGGRLITVVDASVGADSASPAPTTPVGGIASALQRGGRAGHQSAAAIRPASGHATRGRGGAPGIRHRRRLVRGEQGIAGHLPDLAVGDRSGPGGVRLPAPVPDHRGRRRIPGRCGAHPLGGRGIWPDPGAGPEADRRGPPPLQRCG